MNWFTIYLWTRLDSLNSLFTAVAILITILFSIAIIVLIIQNVEGSSDDDEKAVTERVIKKTMFPLILFWFLAIMTPSSKDFALMYALPKIANSDAIQKDLPEIYGLAQERLKELLSGKEK